MRTGVSEAIASRLVEVEARTGVEPMDEDEHEQDCAGRWAVRTSLGGTKGKKEEIEEEDGVCLRAGDVG